MISPQKISQKDVHRVASLARIYLNENEVSDFTVSLERILGYVDQLKSLDTESVQPTSHPLMIENVYREDVVNEVLTVDEALSVAVEEKNGLFKVPKVIE
jgi:aspartyl-tRNA(Asn)/glutamyl-tRNA(Gln) amidotransferase subunit C